MGQLKQNYLISKYNNRKNDKEFHLAQAKFAKFGAIFAGATSGVAAIAALANHIKDKPTDALCLAFFALVSGLICHSAYTSRLDSIKRANKSHKQMRKAQRAFYKNQKQH